jgi:hypothetical protein
MCLPIPPIQQFIHVIFLVRIVQKVQDCVVESLRISRGVIPTEDRGGRQCKAELPYGQGHNAGTESPINVPVSLCMPRKL